MRGRGGPGQAGGGGGGGGALGAPAGAPLSTLLPRLRPHGCHRRPLYQRNGAGAAGEQAGARPGNAEDTGGQQEQEPLRHGGAPTPTLQLCHPRAPAGAARKNLSPPRPPQAQP
eukprot:435355-Prorocentrum_minimum.AAC.1